MHRYPQAPMSSTSILHQVNRSWPRRNEEGCVNVYEYEDKPRIYSDFLFRILPHTGPRHYSVNQNNHHHQRLALGASSDVGAPFTVSA